MHTSHKIFWCHLFTKTSFSFRNKTQGICINGTVVLADPLPERSATLGQDVIVIAVVITDYLVFHPFMYCFTYRLHVV